MSWQTNNIHKKGEGDGKEGVGRERKSREQRSLYVALIVLILAINLAPDSATNPFFLSLSPKTNGGRMEKKNRISRHPPSGTV